jgi:DNA-binding GntR family transcriptional regulator
MASNKFPDWRLYEYMFRHPELLETSLRREYDEHRLIVEALAGGEPEAAASQTLIHIHNLANELVEYLNVSQETLAEREAQVSQMLAVRIP